MGYSFFYSQPQDHIQLYFRVENEKKETVEKHNLSTQLKTTGIPNTVAPYSLCRKPTENFNDLQSQLFTFGILELTELESRIVVRIVVMLSDTLAGTAEGVIKNVHHDNTTRITSGRYTDEMW